MTVRIEPTDAGCRVTLVHEGLDAGQAAGHAMGWEHFFECLERLATSGDVGPDEWKAVPDPLDPIGAAEASLAVLQPVLRGLTSDDQPKATPCADFTCEMAEQVISAWRREGTDETSRPGPAILAVEFLPHGWDLARASGQTVVAADPLVDYVRELAQSIVGGGSRRCDEPTREHGRRAG